MRTRRVFSVAFAACLVATSAFASPRVGDVAQPFEILTYDNTLVKSDDLKGRVVLLNFWATWCAPCRNEILLFDNYMRAHPNSGLVIYAVEVEHAPFVGPMKALTQVLSFSLARSIRGGGFNKKEGVPTSYIIDRDGVVRWARAGAFRPELLEQTIDPLLAAPAAQPAASQQQAVH